MTLDLAAYRAHLERDAAAFGEVAAAHRDGPVAGCPGWTVADLTGHLGLVHRWAATILRTGEPADDPVPVGDPVDWYAGGWPQLLDALDRTDPAAPCWGFGPPPRTASFWWRRQAHETAVHLWDVRTAAGLDAPMPTDLAADGVAEVLEVCVPRQVRLGRTPALPAAIVLTDGDRRWRLGDGEPAATVHGDPLDLLLLLWSRRSLADLAVDGDVAVAEAVLAGTLTP